MGGLLAVEQGCHVSLFLGSQMQMWAEGSHTAALSPPMGPSGCLTANDNTLASQSLCLRAAVITLIGVGIQVGVFILFPCGYHAHLEEKSFILVAC